MEHIDEPLLKAYYQSKLKEYKYDLNGESYVLFCKDIKINNCNVSVVVEYDNNRPAYGIYYGIKMNEDDQLNDIENIKSYFLDNWWLHKHLGYSKFEGDRIFIEGDKGTSGDKTFWPIWIRLEDYRNVSEAIEAAEVIYNYLSGINLSYKSIFFHPWVGPHYSTGGIFGKRIMVLGDSHYCGTPCGKCGVNPNPKCNRLTSDVIGWYLDPNCEREDWMKTYLKFERSLVGHETAPEESKKIWDSIVFYNFLQVALHEPRESGTPEQHQASIGPFFNVLNTYQPDLLIVWGKRLWGNLPGENWIDGSEVLVDGYQVENGYYLLDNGRKVRAICVYHPSVGYSWDFWYKVISMMY